MSANRSSAAGAAAGAAGGMARAVWTPEMVACLLELRLGLLLPRFSRSRAPAQLQDAWNQLHDEFALETGVDVSVPQLKNKYQQLKREYEETQRRLQRRRLSSRAVERDGAGGSDDDADESSSNADAAADDDDDDVDNDPSLPPYWSAVKAAFSGADGRDGVSFFRRPRKKYNARMNGGDGATLAARTPTGSAADDASTVSEADGETPASRRENSSSSAGTAAFTPATSEEAAAPRTAASDAGPARGSAAYPQIAIPRRLSFPSAQQPPRANTSSSSTGTNGAASSGAEAGERPRLSGVKRPLAREDQQQQEEETPPTDASPAAASQVARMRGDLDVAQAIAAAGERIASAMVEAARILAGAAPPRASSLSVEAVRYEDVAAKQAAQERMLEALALSAKSSEALLRTLAESALRWQHERRS